MDDQRSSVKRTNDRPPDGKGSPVRVPYITTWTAETEAPRPWIVVRPGGNGIAYADETCVDRDQDGVLWGRMPSRQGAGKPLFGKVHPLRQRRAMRRMLCQVCGGPADRTADGVLWLLEDYVGDESGGSPEGEPTCQPPVCLPCARKAARACPHLRGRTLTVRVARPVVTGVYGALYRPALPWPEPVRDERLGYGDPRLPWLRGAQLVRELHGCAVVDLEKT